MKGKNPFHLAKALPRQSWSPANLYNLYQRTYGPPTAETKFTKSSLTMFQQKWKAKRLVRAYHGDWIGEKKFKKEYLPDSLPRIVSKNLKDGEDKVPLASMMFVEVEKRIDTVVFRCCFADSAYKARQMVIHGKVSLNGVKHTDPNTRLQPGDLISVEPEAVVTLQPPRPNEAAFKELQSEAAAATPSPEASSPAESESTEASSTPGSTTPSPTESTPTAARPLPFHLPDYAAPFLFIPPYIEPSFSTCSAIYLRHPTVGPGKSEVPSPYDADGEVMRLAWEYYVALGRRGDKKPSYLLGKRQGA